MFSIFYYFVICDFLASCKDHCGGRAPSGCSCDANCQDARNCCNDLEAECPASCKGHCGGVAPSGSCHCDAKCQDAGNCCDDFKAQCPASCKGHCEGVAPSGSCHCDHFFLKRNNHYYCIMLSFLLKVLL